MQKNEFQYLLPEDIKTNTSIDIINQNVKKDLLQIYKPTVNTISDLKSNRDYSKVANPLSRAFLMGKIYYINLNEITGTFSYEVVKELIKLGAYKSGSNYYLPKNKLSKAVQQHIFDNDGNKILSTLNDNINNLIGLMAFKKTFLEDDELNKFKSNTLMIIDKKINLKTQFDFETPYDRYVNEYKNNIDIQIKGFLNQDLIKLRNAVANKIQEGATITELREELKKQYQLNNSRAKRISREETRIFLNKYQDSKFIELGETDYKWFHPDPQGETSRQGHVQLFKRSQAGEIFNLLNDPVDPITGKQTRPGLEFGCRCNKIIQIKKT